MKRVGYLFEKVISLENLNKASKNAQKGKRNYKSVIDWNNNLDKNILELHKELLDNTYKVSEYSVFIIKEPKERVISRLPFRDRVVHHAILIYLEPILVKCLISQTYSCIKGRGIHKCLRDLRVGLDDINHNKYCLKLDIKKFYPSVNNSILKKQIRTKIKDIRLLNLVDRVIDSSIGLTLGNYTSQWFANFYLNKFDHWIKQDNNIKYYFRYCDDLVILGNSKDYLYRLKLRIKHYLSLNLKLQLSNYQVFPVHNRGIDFVGYKSYITHTLLRKSIKQRFKRMTCLNYNKKSISSYYGWIKHCNSINLQRKYLKV